MKENRGGNLFRGENINMLGKTSRNLANLHATLSVPPNRTFSIETRDSRRNQIWDRLLFFIPDLHDRDVCRKDFAGGCCIFISAEINAPSHSCVQRRISSNWQFHIWKVDCLRPKSLLVDTRRIRMIKRGYRRKKLPTQDERSILFSDATVPFPQPLNNRFFDEKFSVHSLMGNW